MLERAKAAELWWEPGKIGPAAARAGKQHEGDGPQPPPGHDPARPPGGAVQAAFLELDDGGRGGPASPLLHRTGSRHALLAAGGAWRGADRFDAMASNLKPKDLSSPKLAGPYLGGGAAALSPLWRSGLVQWAGLLLWVAFCLAMMKESVELMDSKLRALFFYEAFLYYSPIFMGAFMLWLWGGNLFGFSHSRVSYAKVFDLDHNHLTHREIWKIAAGLSVTVLTSMMAYLYLYSHGAVHLAASQPVLLYCTLPLMLALPLDVLYAPSRYYFLNTLFRLTFPLQPISFADFFVADVLTSMAKVLSDLERATCRMSHGQVATIAWFEADDICGSHSIWIPCVLAYPYVCRFFQCLRQYSDTKEKSCLFNALKYSTAFPVIILSHSKYYVEALRWQSFYKPLWIASAILNTCYSYYWDISRDWDFGCFSGNCFSSRNPLLRNNLHYGRRWVYYWAIVSNLGLRMVWTYKLSSHLRHNFATVFGVAALEMVRRFQWIFFRVENEWNKMTMRGAVSEANLKDMDGQEEGKPLIPGRE